MNILITRPLIDSEDLMGKLFSLGHKIIHIPTLKISPAKTESVDLNEYDAINITLGLPFYRISPDHGPNQKMFNKNYPYKSF